MNYSAENHTFVICAYKENPYLEACVQSVLSQTVKSNVLISTSTPNGYICGIAGKYNLPVVVNTEKSTSFHNFNFAYSQAKTELVTLCHQDDYFMPAYLEESLRLVQKSKKMIILFTEYCEDRNGKLVGDNRLLRIKKIMNFPLRASALWGSKWVRRRILSIGNPICCPSVMFHKKAIDGVPFYTEYSNSGDWRTWADLSMLEGEFIYSPKVLLAHRIWEESGTTEMIANGVRAKEDYEIFCSFWPTPIAKVLASLYSSAESSNG